MTSPERRAELLAKGTTPKGGRPRKPPTEVVSVRLPVDVVNRYREAAKRRGMTLSGYVALKLTEAAGPAPSVEPPVPPKPPRRQVTRPARTPARRAEVPTGP